MNCINMLKLLEQVLHFLCLNKKNLFFILVYVNGIYENVYNSEGG
jgi:hypothetical protein